MTTTLDAPRSENGISSDRQVWDTSQVYADMPEPVGPIEPLPPQKPFFLWAPLNSKYRVNKAIYEQAMQQFKLDSKHYDSELKRFREHRAQLIQERKVTIAAILEIIFSYPGLVAAFSLKGGVGKTHAIANLGLAWGALRRNEGVVAVGADSNAGSLSVAMGQTAGYNLEELVEDFKRPLRPVDVNDVVPKTAYRTIIDLPSLAIAVGFDPFQGIMVVASNEDPDRDVLGVKDFDIFLEHIRIFRQAILVDLGINYKDPLTKKAIQTADVPIMVTDMTAESLSQVDQFVTKARRKLEDWQQLSENVQQRHKRPDDYFLDRCILVINKVEPHQQSDAHKAAAYYGQFFSSVCLIDFDPSLKHDDFTNQSFRVEPEKQQLKTRVQVYLLLLAVLKQLSISRPANAENQPERRVLPTSLGWMKEPVVPAFTYDSQETPEGNARRYLREVMGKEPTDEQVARQVEKLIKTNPVLATLASQPLQLADKTATMADPAVTTNHSATAVVNQPEPPAPASAKVGAYAVAVNDTPVVSAPDEPAPSDSTTLLALSADSTNNAGLTENNGQSLDEKSDYETVKPGRKYIFKNGDDLNDIARKALAEEYGRDPADDEVERYVDRIFRTGSNRYKLTADGSNLQPRQAGAFLELPSAA